MFATDLDLLCTPKSLQAWAVVSEVADACLMELFNRPDHLLRCLALATAIRHLLDL